MERVAAGDLLAHLGDDRPGVGLRAERLPDIAWCRVPAGPFLMGSDKKRDKQAYDDEEPQHEVPLPDFSISKYPVTNAQYAAFIEAGGYDTEEFWTGAGWQQKQKDKWAEPRSWDDTRYNGANQPVVGVSWYEAVAYCRWLTERLNAAGELEPEQVIRLPTEAEWEKAARGTDGRIYPWGDEVTPERANYSETGLGATSAVGCFPGGTSPFEALDCAGNVWEWCATKGGKKYPYDATEVEWDEEYLTGTGVRVVRGGAFYNADNGVRAAVRFGDAPGSWNDDLGFRLVRAPIGSES